MKIVSAVVVAALVLFGAGTLVETGSSVVARGEDGGAVARGELPGSGRFEIEYVHSYYRAPTVERFVADEGGGFALVGISSTSDGVLDYYAVGGRKSTDGRWSSLKLDREQRFEELPLIATAKGRKILVVGGERFPLFEDGGPVHLTLRVEEDTPLTEALALLRQGPPSGLRSSGGASRGRH